MVEWLLCSSMDTFRYRRTVDGCLTGAWWSVHGRAEEEMVEWLLCVTKHLPPNNPLPCNHPATRSGPVVKNCNVSVFVIFEQSCEIEKYLKPTEGVDHCEPHSSDFL